MGAGIISKSLMNAAWNGVKNNKINTALTGYMGISTYNESREQGNGMFVSALKAGTEAGYYGIAGGYALAIDAARMLPGLAVSAVESGNQAVRSYERDIRDNTPFKNYTFVDSQQIYTMRQAGLALAQRSRYQLQQSLMGNEAQYMHR